MFATACPPSLLVYSKLDLGTHHYMRLDNITIMVISRGYIYIRVLHKSSACARDVLSSETDANASSSEYAR